MRIKRLLVVLAMVLLSPAAPIAAARAATPAACSWQAEMLEDEGGSVLTASVCQSKHDGAPQLMLQCLGGAHLSYDLGQKGEDVAPDAKAVFTFRVGDTAIDRKLTLEEMYNYFTLDLPRADPLLALLTSGREVSVESATYGKNTFSLEGAKAAIGKVLAKCH